MHRSDINIDETLLEYDGPQIIVGKDFYNASFLCVAIPDAKDAGRFLGARIGEEHLGQFLTGRIDLHYALTSNRKPKFVLFSYFGHESVARFRRYKDPLPNEWLPDRGFFWEATHGYQTEHAASQSVSVAIDGRWDIEDLAEYPQVLAAPYAFLHAVMRGVSEHVAGVADMFQRYPWRGGYSTVNFYRDLYDAIPAPERVVVSKIKYASPGKIELRAATDVIEALHREIATFGDSKSYKLYQELRRQMSSRELLGRTSEEAAVDSETDVFLRDSCVQLAEAISFEQMDRLYALCGDSWVLSAKLLLAYYRRLLELSDFYRSGKAAYLGHVENEAGPSIEG
ncbi:hypothetical protein AWB69_03884 [Caballeronia udeis]|uniref:Uncharacterized protein n=1 Tax=Caballeronia udeis TaxID=1232866 RepID=A0A158H5S4_9BURK|nr:hypothetical protein [Caballeronia udeis]SAL39299.1 hypothetical protein AWB69_03884 [Caballeronia udeis]